MSFIGFVFIYVVGGITFLPLIALAAFIYIKGDIQQLLPRVREKSESLQYKDPDDVIVKRGWIRLINQYQPKMPEIHTTNGNNGSGIISGIQSYVSKEGSQQKKGLVYAVLKHATLFCYESEKMDEVVMILPMQDYQVTLYPPTKPDKPEGAIYGRTAVTRLVPNTLLPVNDDINLTPSICTLSEEDITCNPSRILYLTCARGIDKEDWYLGLLEAQHLLIDNEKDSQYVMMDNTHFDAFAMEELIRQVQSSPSHRETAWINAVFGRLFLGMYKTDRLKNFVEMKIRKKIDKTKRPTFLDEITVRKVDVGESVPFIKDPKLLSLSPNGEVVVEAQVEYNGGLTIEIETDFNLSYHSRMKPIRMHLILSVKLKKMAGRLMFKLKAPPTNRYWLAFFEMPEMEWKITPVVADKQIKLAIVTNAIESRIREVMAETFVLPNMDDTSFCPSQGKGGIFGEYVKVKRRKSGETPAYVRHQDQKDTSKKHARDDSVSSEHSRFRETPTVPDQSEKIPAADVLKLKTRGAESVSEFDLAGSSTPKIGLDSQKIEMSCSTPELLFVHNAKSHSIHSDDNESIKSTKSAKSKKSVKSEDQQSIAESTTSTSSGTKWSNTSNYLRKRMMKTGVHNDGDEKHQHQNDTESVKSNSGSSGGLLGKVARLLPADSLPPSSDSRVDRSDTQTSTSSTGSNKKNSLIHMAENFLARKTNQHDERPNDEPLSEEKRSSYAERIANMRKRAEEKRSSISSTISSIRSPPSLPSSPTRSSTQSSTSLLDDSTLQSELNSNIQSPIMPTFGRVISTDSSKSLMDDDNHTAAYTNADLPMPIKPTRGRAASTSSRHKSISSSLTISSDSSSRRNSTPPTFTPKGNVVNSNEEQAGSVEVSEEPKRIVDPVIIEEEDPVTTTSTVSQPSLLEESEPTVSIDSEKKTNLPPLPNKPRPSLPTSPRPKIPSQAVTQEVTKSKLELLDLPPSYQEDETSKPGLPSRENHNNSLPPPPFPPRHS